MKTKTSKVYTLTGLTVLAFGAIAGGNYCKKSKSKDVVNQSEATTVHGSNVDIMVKDNGVVLNGN